MEYNIDTLNGIRVTQCGLSEPELVDALRLLSFIRRLLGDDTSPGEVVNLAFSIVINKRKVFATRSEGKENTHGKHTRSGQTD